MITKADLQLAEDFLRSEDESPVLGPVAATPGAAILEAAAADNANIAAMALKGGNRRMARAHLLRALEQLNEAELE